ncbi:RHS repeat-associated core domain-containing protein, partial [Paenibacillus sp. NRS-1780]|uniref:RHS repeat-associated core domain-containing protein n=2 Tax=unclassified Paenibacillus TaxID=185978 RepID=UPI003D291C04
HGDVVGLSDSSGKELNSYSYDIWGGPKTVKETVPNVLRYAGEYWDETTGLQYLRARWYDPGTARFMGEDTYQGEMSDPQSLNWYAYVANNPLKYTDPSGHKVWLVHGTISDPSTWDNSKNYIEKELFHEPIKALPWSGKNSDGARVEGAEIVANEIYNYHKAHPKEPIRIMGHSHGGNVSIMATNILAKRGMHVDTLITIATPIRGYRLETDVGQHINVYNYNDIIQINGGSIWVLGDAKRKYPGAENVEVKLPSYFIKHPIEAHSVMHSSPNILDKYVKPLLLQHNFSEARYKNLMENRATH